MNKQYEEIMIFLVANMPRLKGCYAL